MRDKKNKFAIVGCGQIAERHAKHINNVGKLQAVCDIKIERAWKLQEKYSGDDRVLDVVACSSIDQLLEYGEQIDVVSICTPNYLHAEHTIKALKAGFHVLCEKPMAITLYDCERMIKVAKETQRHLFVVKQNRFNPPVQEVKQLIDSGKLGKILSIQVNCFWNRNSKYYQNSDWRGNKNMDGGTLLTVFCHFVDLLHWMIGEVVEVHSMLGNFKHPLTVQFEDTGVAILRFFNGAIGTLNYTVNAHSKNMEGSITIFGSNGTIKVGGQYLNELEYQDMEDHKIKKLPKGNPPNNYGYYIGSMSNHGEVYKNVVETLQNGKPMATGIDGLRTVEIIEKIYKGAK